MSPIHDKWLTIDELAAYLKMGRTKLYTMAQNGTIPGSKIGSQWRFDREEIDAWIKSGLAAKPESKSAGRR
jgi:excisionase family DNA binding protein